ncbi:MAG: hypothetical protein L6R39_006929 [Caloplaca ligustica]|nr:MAG: hypothetical protein L6R39_006929 [Caloplaca ligustica]
MSNTDPVVNLRDRSFLFLEKLSMKSMANGRSVEPRVKSTTQAPSQDVHSHSSSSKAKPNVPKTTNGSTSAASPRQVEVDIRPLPLPQDETKVVLEGQRKDIDRIMTDVEHLLQDMKSMKASMDYLKFQQQTFANFGDQEAAETPSVPTQNLEALTERVSHLSAKFDKIDALSGKAKSLLENVSSIVTKAKEVDTRNGELLAMVKDRDRLDTRDNEVDLLKVELKLMKRRVQQLESINGYQSNPNLASKRQASLGSNMERAKLLRHDPGASQEIPSSTPEMSESEQTLVRARRSHSTVSLQETGHDYLAEGTQDEPQRYSQAYNDKEATPEGDLVDLLRPRITSADKVAAQKRRDQRSSSSPSSTSSSPPHKRPRMHGQPDWNVKPRVNGSARRKLTSLNDFEHVLTSDPEDSDFNPMSFPDDFADPQSKDKVRARSKAPLRLPTPEWEKPDWEGPQLPFQNSSTRGKISSRRGVSGRGSLPDRNAVRRRSAGYRNADYVSAQSPDYWDDEPSTQRESNTPDLFAAKPRDSQGRLLRPNGKVDGRSLRYQREREAKTRLAAQLQAAQQESDNNKQPPGDAEGQQNQTQVEDQAFWTESSNYVDATALRAAGYGVPAANRSPKDPAASTVVLTYDGPRVQEQPEVADPSGSTTTGPAAAQQQVGGDKHAKLMNRVFPWR